MDNYTIAEQFSLLAKLMDIHGENSFKTKSYAAAAFTIEKLPQPVAGLPEEKIFSLKGVGESVGKKVLEIIQTGELEILQTYLRKTPEGVLELMNIKGLGPKKIHVLWKELGINSIDKLRTACETDVVAQTKGFGEKTQESILEAIEFQRENKGWYLYAQVEAFAEAFDNKLKEKFKAAHIQLTGSFRRQMEVIEILEWVVTIPERELIEYLLLADFSITSQTDTMIICNAQDALVFHFYCTEADHFTSQLFLTTGSEEFITTWKEEYGTVKKLYTKEEEIFTSNHLPYIPPFLREGKSILQTAKAHGLPEVIQTDQIKGLIHSHSNWSDGAVTIEKMAKELIRLGFEYLVISDHSKAAYYAGGLSEQRIEEQHRYIDELNKKFHPFKIFKSIECDILNDGSLDYSNKILSTFDLVIASVHSNLGMEEGKAMKRLLGAISNPYTTILGHMTGRVLLKRKGYPVDHITIIDACAQNKVVIEINASPSRLDMHWQWIHYALEKEVLLSINPDAHSPEEFGSIRYGVLVAQKGGLTKEKNLSSFSLRQFEEYLLQRKKEKGIR